MNLQSFLLLAPGMSREDIARMAVLVLSVYTVTNRYRRLPAPSESEVRDALEEVAKQEWQHFSLFEAFSDPASKNSLCGPPLSGCSAQTPRTAQQRSPVDITMAFLRARNLQ